MDYRPSRMAVIAKLAEAFIREFFDQNPLSHVGLVTIKDGISHRLTDIGGSPESQIKALMGKLECSGDSSLQNALELVHGYLDQVPSYGHKEVLILYSALNTCDPGDIMETIEKCKKSKIRCSVIGLAAEIFICKHLCEETGGSYTVALDESHFKELLLEHAPPPPAIAEYAAANLIKMGFPQRGAEDLISICSCHKKIKSGAEDGQTSLHVRCPKCNQHFCLDCDIYIHESLHNCPGCESQRGFSS
ncbi:GTF2H2 [Panicum miliaceum]|uniref:GTF2H2 n=1 Tax=Panicum miliaceum TaxID=4540 RepID=A0A3L6PVT7_PANMI|nr:GTF2H2 [Panicum miliaceum]